MPGFIVEGRPMKSWWIRSEGGSTLLDLRDVAAPKPASGQILVRTHAAALNRGEFIASLGLHAAGAAAKPAGQECAGEVIEVGDGVTAFRPGDRVMGRAPGGFAERALLDVRETMAVPARLSWEEAAATPLVYLVSYDMLYPGGNLAPGEWLLVMGASSGVGVASVQIGKLVGANVMGTSGSAAKLARLRAFGLDVGIQVRGGGFLDAVMKATGGKGADLVVNAVGGTVFAECVRALAFRGRLATVGYVDGVMRSEIDLEALHSKRLRLFGVSNKLRTAPQRAETVGGFVRDVLPALADGRIRPVVDRVFPFAELPVAKAYMESDAQVGKVVVTVG
jgi:NADPH:quinone reductase-like Zn-dependent oxidoreductase